MIDDQGAAGGEEQPKGKAFRGLPPNLNLVTSTRGVLNEPRAPVARWVFHSSAYASRFPPLLNAKTPDYRRGPSCPEQEISRTNS